jgi:Carboxypeptidase regulatory-like domain
VKICKSGLWVKCGVRSFLLAHIGFSGLLAQSVDTGILGAVSDQTGSLIVGATVTVTSPATGFSKSVVTGNEGQYEIRYLMPGEYRIETRSNGFRPARTSGLTLQIAQLARVDIRLELGAIAEAVEVGAQSVILETQSAVMGSVVASQSVVDLPLNGRSFAQLGNLTPGVVASASHEAR